MEIRKGNLDKAVERLLSRVDFNTIHAVMQLTGWNGNTLHVPTAEELKSRVGEMVREAITTEVLHGCDFGSGGFRVQAHGTGVAISFQLVTAITSLERPVGKDNWQ